MSDALPCKHYHGDFIKPLGAWVCGQCFEMLAERPKKYKMTLTAHATATRQEIIWQAEVRRSQEGTTLSFFLRIMVKRYQYMVTGMRRPDAYKTALDCLKSLSVDFGHSDFCWTRSTARELVDEDISYWEQTGND